MAEKERGDYAKAYAASKAVNARAEKEFHDSFEKDIESGKPKSEPHPEIRDVEQEHTMESHSIPSDVERSEVKE
jgi:hypothetical protein